VRIIENPENLGAGAVRNIMIEQARGKYLFF
jgi:glycosyltransferase involved in cell wall biosynthesis